MGNNGVESPGDVSIERELDELEQKVLRAAEMIEQLRSEKKRLEAECDKLRGERQVTVNRLSRILEKVESIESDS